MNHCPPSGCQEDKRAQVEKDDREKRQRKKCASHSSKRAEEVSRESLKVKEESVKVKTSRDSRHGTKSSGRTVHEVP